MYILAVPITTRVLYLGCILWTPNLITMGTKKASFFLCYGYIFQAFDSFQDFEYLLGFSFLSQAVDL